MSLQWFNRGCLQSSLFPGSEMSFVSLTYFLQQFIKTRMSLDMIARTSTVRVKTDFIYVSFTSRSCRVVRFHQERHAHLRSASTCSLLCCQIKRCRRTCGNNVTCSPCCQMKRCRRAREYDRLTIVFEEDSPIPPPTLPTIGHREVVPTASS